MSEPTSQPEPSLQSAFREYELGVRISNYRVACVLALIFMPAGAILDIFTLQPQRGLVSYFFTLRLICSLLLFGIWWLVRTPFGLRHLWVLGQVVAGLPSLFISLMIYETDGGQSHYYAGINLVLLGAGLVLRWTLLDSICVCATALSMYLAACFWCPNVSLRQAWESGEFFNNLYFLVVTAVFVVIGNLHYNRIRFREFQLRWELDRNRAQLEDTNRKLLELDQIKSRFFANISHELRTPLTLLLAPLETLLERFSLSVDHETRSILLTMRSNGMRLLKLINDLLDLVRLESGKMDVKHDAVAVEEVLKGLASSASAVASEKRISLTCQVDPQIGKVVLDRDKLEKIVLNLLFNALKFTPAGGRVELKAARRDQELAISVADNGVGISEKNLPFVFDRFWQADGSSVRKHQGVGIGLALVKELAEIQGGKVAVESTLGVGTTFTVAFPYRGAQAATPAHASAEKNGDAAVVSSEEWLANLYRRAELFPGVHPVQEAIKPVEVAGSNGKPTILLADDEPDMLRFLGSQLSAHYRVIEATDGEQAIEKSRRLLPDLIVLDMMMPGKDGLQACQAIRENAATRPIPVLLLTARADEETKLAALSAGANDFLAKPFSTTELFVRIKNLVDAYAYQCTLAKQKHQLEQTIDLLKETETQLVQSEKLASLGRMSAGIIHEINNPLNYAATGLFTLRKKGAQLSPKDQIEYNEILNDVEEGVARVKTIVTDLRTFTRPDADCRETVDLVSTVAAALRFTSGEWKDTVRISQSLPEQLLITANRNKMIQVLVNLIQNSLDAMKAKAFVDETPTIWVEGAEAEGTVVLKVRDNGAGVRPEIRDKIFEPFFTTKEVGKGMGLGLSICYRIVQEFGGQIRLRSETGQFCEFALEFPATGGRKES